jgi:hypothetical protein
MLLYQGFSGGQEQDPASIKPGEKNHKSNHRLAKARGDHNQARGFKGTGGQIQLKEPLFHCLWLDERMLKVRGHMQPYSMSLY